MTKTELIRELREKTGSSIGDCNKAIKECGENIEKAVDWLRKKGIASAAKKSSRETNEGVVGISVNNKSGSIVEINSETDFVAKNDKFQAFATNILKAIESSNASSLVGLLSEKYPDSDNSIENELKNQINIIGENIKISKLENINIDKGFIASYIHNAIGVNLGKIAVLVAIETDSSSEELKSLGKQIAMHVAATKPEFLSVDAVDQKKLSSETEILKAQAKASGKPDSIVDKMVEGRIKKYYNEVVLLEQNFVMDDKKKISEVIAEFNKKNNTLAKIVSFKIIALGN
jgi:elongation factor Ts